MKAVIQRVSKASVSLENKIYTEINNGLLVFLGIEKDDREEHLSYLISKILSLRIFEDADKKMNFSVKDVNGELLIISQFTLCTDNTKSGNRPSFSNAMIPHDAKRMYEQFISRTKQNYISERVKEGVFAGKMQISLINEGPVTIQIDTNNKFK